MSNSMKMMSSGRSKMMEGTNVAAFGTHFLEMILARRGAVLMAINALQKSERAKIKTLANQIIKAREAAMKQMNDWKSKWTKQQIGSLILSG